MYKYICSYILHISSISISPYLNFFIRICIYILCPQIICIYIYLVHLYLYLYIYPNECPLPGTVIHCLCCILSSPHRHGCRAQSRTPPEGGSSSDIARADPPEKHRGDAQKYAQLSRSDIFIRHPSGDRQTNHSTDRSDGLYSTTHMFRMNVSSQGLKHMYHIYRAGSVRSVRHGCFATSLPGGI